MGKQNKRLTRGREAPMANHNDDCFCQPRGYYRLMIEEKRDMLINNANDAPVTDNIKCHKRIVQVWRLQLDKIIEFSKDRALAKTAQGRRGSIALNSV